MGKKKDSLRREAMEIAFNTLRRLPPAADAASLKSQFAELTGCQNPEQEHPAWRLAFEIWNHNGELQRATAQISPGWLLESLDRDDKILNAIMLYEIQCLEAPAKVVVRQIMDIARQQARRFAFQTLYSLSFQTVANSSQLEKLFINSARDLDDSAIQKTEGFAWKLVYGVWKNDGALKNLILQFSHNWRPERMGNVEITLLMLGLYEIFCCHESPALVSGHILDLASEFVAAKALNFIKGVLAGAAHANFESIQLDCSEK